MTVHGLLAAAASAPITHTIRSRAMDTVLQREGDEPVWTVKTKNLDLIRALDEACGCERGVAIVRSHEMGIVKAAEYEVEDALLASLVSGLDADPPVPPAVA